MREHFRRHNMLLSPFFYKTYCRKKMKIIVKSKNYEKNIIISNMKKVRFYQILLTKM